MRRIEAIIFDKDGTLFDFAATWSGLARGLLDQVEASSLGDVGAVAAAIGFDRLADGFRPDSLFIAGTSGEVEQAILRTGGQASEIIRVMNNLVPRTQQVPVPALRETLAHLGLGRILGVATNDAEAHALAHLEAHDLSQHFDFIAGYDSGFGAKPASGQLLGFCEATGARAETTAMVGDSRHDLAAGRAAGMITIAVLTGIAERAELEDLADVVLADIGGISGWLANGHGS